MKNYDAGKQWTKDYLSQKEMAYPSEYVIRIFKGVYPKLNLDKKSFQNKKICDLGCGDGRNLQLLSQCGFQVYGMEITKEIIGKIILNLKRLKIKAQIHVGTNEKISYGDNFFDYLLSWNSCYYMGGNLDFNKHISEMSRVLKKGGYLILSIPKKSCFIYHGSENLKGGYKIIKNDPFNIRNGDILKIFRSETEIKHQFSKYFTNFVFASIHDDCFGFDYHWHIIVCQKR